MKTKSREEMCRDLLEILSVYRRTEPARLAELLCLVFEGDYLEKLYAIKFKNKRIVTLTAENVHGARTRASELTDTDETQIASVTEAMFVIGEESACHVEKAA